MSDFLLRFGQDEAVQVFLGIFSELIWTSLALFNAPFSSDTDFCTTLFLHILQAITTRAHEKTEEVDLGELFNGNVYLFRWTLRALLLMVLNWRAEIWVIFHGAINKANAFILQLLPISNLTSVGASPVGIVSGWRRR